MFFSMIVRTKLLKIFYIFLILFLHLKTINTDLKLIFFGQYTKEYIICCSSGKPYDYRGDVEAQLSPVLGEMDSIWLRLRSIHCHHQ
jgi:hypothetical protein